ncbi:MAG: ferredoxin [Acidimicrobiales bacterium]
MKILVNQDLCSSEGACAETLPLAFTMGDDCFAHVTQGGSLGEGGTDMVVAPSDLERDVRSVIADYPTEWVFVVKD